MSFILELENVTHARKRECHKIISTNLIELFMFRYHKKQTKNLTFRGSDELP
jgi:hypothetical protein